MDSVDITAILNLHREGLLASPSIRSLFRAKTRAERDGVKVEVIAVLDRSDELTKDMIKNTANLRTIHVEEGDLGEARNLGVRQARGDWIAFLDADDLWGEEWITAAYAVASREPREIVWHPEVNLYFGGNTHLFQHLDMEEPKFEPISLLISNYWTSLCFARRSVLLEIPYRRIHITNQIGYEDWAWHMETIAQGILHKIVPGTAHAIRVREDSLGQLTRAAGALPYPANSFRNIVIGRLRSGHSD